MSNTRRAAIGATQGPTLVTTGKRKTTKADKKPFTIDEVTFHLVRPKAVMMGTIAQLVDPRRPWDESENYRVLLQYTGQLVEYVEQTERDAETGKPTGRMLLEQRLNDPTDALDLTDLVPLLADVMQGWFSEDRPTGQPAGSKPRPARSRSAGPRASTA